MQLYERSRTARLHAGDVVGAATAANNLAGVLSDQGRLPEAAEAFTEALAVWTRAAYPVGVAVAQQPGAASHFAGPRTRRGSGHDHAARGAQAGVEVLTGGRRETSGALPASVALAIGRDGT